MTVVRSGDNARVKAWVRLAAESKDRRAKRLALIEGIHLVETFLNLGRVPVSLIVSESAIKREDIQRILRRSSREPVLLADGLFNRISDAKAPVGIAAEITIPAAQIDPATSSGCVFLEGVQDAGNIGTILRSAAAFGVPDVILGRGCADPWSPKALRAGMGGHFFVRVVASADLAADVRRFGRHTICTVVNGGEPIDSIVLSGRIGWIFGGEGAGVSDAVAGLAARKATIQISAGAESLNVAAAAAICFYERARQLNKRGARS